MVSDRQRAELLPGPASFHLLEGYVKENGPALDAEQACHWLLKAARSIEDGHLDYLAQAWAWRLYRAFEGPLPCPKQGLKDFLTLSVMRDHRACLEDIEKRA